MVSTSSAACDAESVLSEPCDKGSRYHIQFKAPDGTVVAERYGCERHPGAMVTTNRFAVAKEIVPGG